MHCFLLINQNFILAARRVRQVSHRPMAEEGVQVMAVINVITTTVITIIMVVEGSQASTAINVIIITRMTQYSMDKYGVKTASNEASLYLFLWLL